MYNRYIPQGDGSYRRNPTPDAPRIPTGEAAKPSAPPVAPISQAPAPTPPEQPNPHLSPSAPKQPIHIGSFLKNLLPKGFDTGDLLVVLLILIMAGDCQEDQNTALLTLALYFFL